MSLFIQLDFLIYSPLPLLRCVRYRFINREEYFLLASAYNLTILMFIRASRLSARVSRIRIAALDLFKSHVIPRETKRLQRDSAYKDELKYHEERRERGGLELIGVDAFREATFESAIPSGCPRRFSLVFCLFLATRIAEDCTRRRTLRGKCPRPVWPWATIPLSEAKAMLFSESAQRVEAMGSAALFAEKTLCETK